MYLSVHIFAQKIIPAYTYIYLPHPHQVCSVTTVRILVAKTQIISKFSAKPLPPKCSYNP